LRRTPVRLDVLALLSRSAAPLAVPQILEKLPAGTDAVTVYRTLNTFMRKRLVHRVRGEDGTSRYALGDTAAQFPRHQHPHFVCQDCGRVECLGGAQVPSRLMRMLGVDEGYQVHYAEVVLHGRCPRCRRARQ
jgi:Fe2+ or Zn2+ uptake regulation protein